VGQSFSYLYPSQWLIEGQIWRPPDTITLRDEAGVVIGSTAMATMVLTLYDLSGGQLAIVNSVEQTDIKNARSCTLSTQGVFVLTLLPADNVILNAAHEYEIRRALIQYEWPSTPTKSDALEITYIVRNLARRPYVAP
jgi:hypothetical protein